MVPSRWLLPSAVSCALPYVTARAGRRTIVLSAFHGQGFRGSPRALMEQLCSERTFDPVWLSTDQAIVDQVRGRFGEQRAELAHSSHGVWALARARAIVVSHGITDLPYLHLRRGAIVLHTWHGLPTKLDDLAQLYVPLRERLRVWRQWAPCSHLLSSSPLVSQLCVQRFGLRQDQVLELGYPAYDALCQGRQARLDSAALFPQAPAHRGILLYAPTFVPSRATRWFPFDDFDATRFARLLDELRLLCCLRPHPDDDASVAHALSWSPRVVLADQKKLEDTTPLIAAASMIVTDYSSIYLEGLLADAPCAFIPDPRIHGHNEPSWDYERHTPGPKLRSFDDFERALRRALTDRKADAEARARVRDSFFTRVDGRASERVVQWLDQAIGV